jgi:hypothetical protein
LQGESLRGFGAEVVVKDVAFEQGAKREVMSDVQRVVSGHGNVWCDAGAFPVRSGDGVDRSAAGYERRVLLVQSDAVTSMGAAYCCFADEGCPIAGLEIVGELFGAGEGLITSEDVEGLVGSESRTGNIRQVQCCSVRSPSRR